MVDKGIHASYRISMLENFPPYIMNRVFEMSKEVLQELKDIQYVKSKGRPPYSSKLIRFALMQRYTSRQSYKLLLEEMPQGGIAPMKALMLLLENGHVDCDVVLIIDEMYLQKSCEYSRGEFVGKNEDGVFYNGIMVFMIVSLKKSIPFVIKSCPKTKIDGKWIFSHVSESIETLNKSGFCVKAVISDNHSVNVSTFTIFKKMYAADSSDMLIISPSIQNKIFVLRLGSSS